MDETDGVVLYDSWNGNNGNINSCTRTQMGKSNGGLVFDGATSSYVNLPDNFISTLTDFTIGVWVKPDALETWARIFDFGLNTNYNMFLAPAPLKWLGKISEINTQTTAPCPMA
jgi:hypothetical protein